MIIRVVAIKELFGKKYSIDLLFFGLSEEQVRDVLREYKLIALELHEYPKEKVDSYGNIKILIKFEGEIIHLLTKATEIESEIYLLSTIGFDIVNINYVNEEKKIEQNAINEVIKTEKEKAEKWINEQNEIIQQNKKKNEEMFDDSQLEKVQKLAKDVLEKIPPFIEKAQDTISKTELRELQNQRQELSKLEMGSNVEKISSYLEEVYHNYNRLEQSFLSIQESPNIEVSGSNVSDAYLVSEITKLENAKNLQKLGGAKSGEDALYVNLGIVLLYFRLLKRDIKSKIKNFSLDFAKILENLILSFCIISLLSAVYIAIINKNDFAFIIMICSGVFGLVLHLIKYIKLKKQLSNLLLLIVSLIVSVLLILFLKQLFIF